MAGAMVYTEEQIKWVLKQLVHRVPGDQIKEGFAQKFGFRLIHNKLRYIKNKYGRDPHYGAPLVNFTKSYADDLDGFNANEDGNDADDEHEPAPTAFFRHQSMVPIPDLEKFQEHREFQEHNFSFRHQSKVPIPDLEKFQEHREFQEHNFSSDVMVAHMTLPNDDLAESSAFGQQHGAEYFDNLYDADGLIGDVSDQHNGMPDHINGVPVAQFSPVAPVNTPASSVGASEAATAPAQPDNMSEFGDSYLHPEDFRTGSPLLGNSAPHTAAAGTGENPHTPENASQDAQPSVEGKGKKPAEPEDENTQSGAALPGANRFLLPDFQLSQLSDRPANEQAATMPARRVTGPIWFHPVPHDPNFRVPGADFAAPRADQAGETSAAGEAREAHQAPQAARGLQSPFVGRTERAQQPAPQRRPLFGSMPSAGPQSAADEARRAMNEQYHSGTAEEGDARHERMTHQPVYFDGQYYWYPANLSQQAYIASPTYMPNRVYMPNTAYMPYGPMYVDWRRYALEQVQAHNPSLEQAVEQIMALSGMEQAQDQQQDAHMNNLHPEAHAESSALDAAAGDADMSPEPLAATYLAPLSPPMDYHDLLPIPGEAAVAG